jgi:hypothetical protein
MKSKNNISLEDIKYCRDALQKVKVPCPAYYIWDDTFYKVLANGKVYSAPLDENIHKKEEEIVWAERSGTARQ